MSEIKEIKCNVSLIFYKDAIFLDWPINTNPHLLSMFYRAFFLFLFRSVSLPLNCVIIRPKGGNE